MNIHHGHHQTQSQANLAFNARLGYRRFKQSEQIWNGLRPSKREDLIKVLNMGFSTFHKEHVFSHVPKYIRDEVINYFVLGGSIS